jgi:hypothetical protein
MIFTISRDRYKLIARVVLGVLAIGVSSACCVNAANTDPVVTAEPAIRILGIGAPPYDDHSWWSADGSRLAHSPLVNISATQPIPPWQPSADETERVVVLDIPAVSGRDTTVVLSGSTHSSSTITSSEYYVEHFIVPKTAQTCSIRVGLASSPWYDLADSDGKGTSSVDCSVPGPNSNKTVGVIFAAVSLFGQAPGITVSSTLGPNYDARVVFVDQSGNEVIPDSASSASSDNIQQRTVTSSSLSIVAIKSVKFEERPFDWTELNNIPLSANTPGN